MNLIPLAVHLQEIADAASQGGFDVPWGLVITVVVVLVAAALIIPRLSGSSTAAHVCKACGKPGGAEGLGPLVAGPSTKKGSFELYHRQHRPRTDMESGIIR